MSISKDILYPAITADELGSSLWTEDVCLALETDFQERQKWWAKRNLDEDVLHYPEYTHLYKYRAVDPKHPERTEKMLSDKTLWAASLVRLNDPLEAAFIVAANTASSAVAKMMNNAVHGNWWGCVCFSADPICVQMWAHYSAEHSGFCVQYRRADSFLLSTKNCQPMYYTYSPPVLNILDDRIHQIFWTKSDVWEYE